MLYSSPLVGWGLALAVLSGLMNGTFTVPMRFMDRWSWENVWAIFILVSCLIMPVTMALATVSRINVALVTAPKGSIAIALITGFIWGFGAIMFGQGVSAVGISMGNTLVLAISASLGSFLPVTLINPAELLQTQGKILSLAVLVGLFGIVLCGYAGLHRERSQKDRLSEVRGHMVGKLRPFWEGFLLCAGAGLLSAIFNIGYTSAQGLEKAAMRLGNSSFAGSNLIWLLMLTSGAVSNLLFCGYLFRREKSWSNYHIDGSYYLCALPVLMGLLWGGSIFAYGAAAPRLGRLGPAIGWPLTLIVGLLIANLWGWWAGEWKMSSLTDRRWMRAGVGVLFLAILLLGWSSAFGR